MDENPIPVLILSNSDVENIFSIVQSDSNRWFPSPLNWYKENQSISLGGFVQNKELRFIVHFQEIPMYLPNIFGLIQGNDQTDHFVLLTFRLIKKQQETIINEIIHSFQKQIQNGWQPK